MKKNLKKQMKQDELATGFDRLWRMAHAHLDEIKIAAVVITVLVVGALALQHFRRVRDRDAREALAAAVEVYRAPVTGENPQPESGSGPVFATAQEKYRKALGDFEGVARRYGSHEAGLRARYYAALCQIELGQNADAEKTLNEIAGQRSSDRLEPSLARLALADVQGRTDQIDRAVDSYNQIVNDPQFALPRDHALISLAKLLEQAKRVDEARAAYRRLVDEFPESAYVTDARQRAEYLGARS